VLLGTSGSPVVVLVTEAGGVTGVSVGVVLGGGVELGGGLEGEDGLVVVGLGVGVLVGTGLTVVLVGTGTTDVFDGDGLGFTGTDGTTAGRVVLGDGWGPGATCLLDGDGETVTVVLCPGVNTTLV
jgi:hypothetical protein